MTLNVALLGTGRIAEYGYIPAISKIDDVNIISVLSRSDIRGSEFAIKHSIPSAYVEIDDLLADNNLAKWYGPIFIKAITTLIIFNQFI